ncbi:hypothetical protein K443DRAFT_3846 [Laccaria amethystina LaAM-08-1]|uniref:Uncharacterized protein n=1 Tax=Laccaria amethystina LaAM-08-1 TaxID=1095629 RepID=A0A0C9XVI1_9AGAR|nr:hypothetical protein K443DRAFT_3846 [Laccaria amethystina LaAM-08-1]
MIQDESDNVAGNRTEFSTLLQPLTFCLPRPSASLRPIHELRRCDDDSRLISSLPLIALLVFGFLSPNTNPSFSTLFDSLDGKSSTFDPPSFTIADLF